MINTLTERAISEEEVLIEISNMEQLIKDTCRCLKRMKEHPIGDESETQHILEKNLEHNKWMLNFWKQYLKINFRNKN